MYGGNVLINNPMVHSLFAAMVSFGGTRLKK
jgi:hypothetical protein